MHVAQRTFGSLALAVGLLLSTSVEAGQQALDTKTSTQGQTQDAPYIQRRIPEVARKGAVPFARTELYFGTAKPDGVVSLEEFRHFIDTEVTPRFPDGLTVLKADGQFRGEGSDIIVKEKSFVLILLYPYESLGKSSQRIQRIRDLYKERFKQQSVLRVDDPYTVWVSF